MPIYRYQSQLSCFSFPLHSCIRSLEKNIRVVFPFVCFFLFSPLLSPLQLVWPAYVLRVLFFASMTLALRCQVSSLRFVMHHLCFVVFDL